MKYLIVTADDFGLTKSINEGVMKARREGIVTSVSFMPAGEAFDDAVRLARHLGLKEIGAHLSLTETGPLTALSRIGTIVTKGGVFYKSRYGFLINFFLKRIDPSHIYIELKSQMAALAELGIPITSLSSHEHIHMVPDILDIFLRIAGEYDIKIIRYPRGEKPARRFDLKSCVRSGIISWFDRRMKTLLDRYGMVYPDYFLGFLDSGRIEESILMDMLASLKEGVTELVCHPGFLGPEVLDRYRFHLNSERELFALTSPRVKKIIKEKDIKLISHSEFIKK